LVLASEQEQELVTALVLVPEPEEVQAARA
jgi:hypothetical protein